MWRGKKVKTQNDQNKTSKFEIQRLYQHHVNRSVQYHISSIHFLLWKIELLWITKDTSNDVHTSLYISKENRQLLLHHSPIEFRRRRSIDLIINECQTLLIRPLKVKGKSYLFVLNFFIFCLWVKRLRIDCEEPKFAVKT